MPCDLKKKFANLAKRLPTKSETSFLFKKNFGAPGAKTWVTDRILVDKGIHAYGSREVVMFHFSATKETYRHLALFLLSRQMSSSCKNAELLLTHPHSAIRKIIIANHPHHDNWEVLWDIASFDYHPCLLKGTKISHPLLQQEDRQPQSNCDFPSFLLWHEAGYETGPSDRDANTLLGFGSKIAAITLAKTLLDFGLPQSKTNEMRFESFAPLASVEDKSAEAVFWLPGSSGYRL